MSLPVEVFTNVKTDVYAFYELRNFAYASMGVGRTSSRGGNNGETSFSQLKTWKIYVSTKKL